MHNNYISDNRLVKLRGKKRACLIRRMREQDVLKSDFLAFPFIKLLHNPVWGKFD